jgi:hypothetical protein
MKGFVSDGIPALAEEPSVWLNPLRPNLVWGVHCAGREVEKERPPTACLLLLVQEPNRLRHEILRDVPVSLGQLAAMKM